MADVVVKSDGGTMSSVFLLEPQTDKGSRWLKDHCEAEAWQWVGDSLAVEHRYMMGLVEAMETAGLEVR